MDVWIRTMDKLHCADTKWNLVLISNVFYAFETLVNVPVLVIVWHNFNDLLKKVHDK